ncbi:hypothetical protein GCM10011587_23640 [Pyruvatibacter mobilis]|nr:hypothetical protein GCM10011587_23640 [Pyruvatibacter mobilis]
MISVIDENGRVIYSNPVGKHLFEVFSGAVDRLGPELFHPDDYPLVATEFGQLVEHGGRRQLTDHRMRTVSGNWIWVQTHAINMLDDPNVNGVVMVTRDIIAQKRREEEIQRAEKAVNFGHWRWDKYEPGPYWSDGMFSMVGLRREDMPTDMRWTLDLMSPDDSETVFTEVMEALVSGASFNRIVSMRHSDGTYRRTMLMGHVERDGSGDAVSIVGICQDVTELESANEAVRQSEQEFRLLAEHSTDAIARFTKDGRIAYISPSIERILGHKPENCTGLMAAEFLHPDDLVPVTAAVEAMRFDRQMRRTSFRMKRTDGHYVWLEAALGPLFDAHDNFEGFVSCTRDITEQKRREQELMAARERAEQASMTKSRFLANMSHELRTPLNAILGFSEMMTRQVFGPLGAQQYDEYAGHIHESGSHLLSLIGDILDMSKIEAGKYDLTVEDVPLAPILRKAGRMVETRVAEGEIELLIDADDVDGMAVYADERALIQVMLNVLSNAVKFTPAGGRITVAAAPSDAGAITISVTDTGVGIEEKDLERVLHPFEQVVKHAELASQGTGLGLPLVKALVELQDGRFDISSQPGAGTTVAITLPAAVAARVPAAPDVRQQA